MARKKIVKIVEYKSLRNATDGELNGLASFGWIVITVNVVGDEVVVYMERTVMR